MGSPVREVFDRTMSTPHTRLVVALVAGALLLTGAAGGAAVATGKIRANQIARNAIRSKHLKAGNVTGDKVATATLTGDKLANNTLTGTQLDEATLGRVPDAAAIAGAKVTPISLVMPNTQPASVTVATGPGWTLQFACNFSNVEAIWGKSGTASLVTVRTILAAGGPLVAVAPNSSSQTLPSTYVELRLVSVTGGTATTTVDVTAVFAAGQFTSQSDCFVRGTITTTP